MNEKPMTRTEWRALKAVVDVTTQGDWRVGRKVGRTLYKGYEDGDLIGVLDRREDAEFCAFAHEMIPRLLATCEKLAEEPAVFEKLRLEDRIKELELERGAAAVAFGCERLDVHFLKVDLDKARNESTSLQARIRDIEKERDEAKKRIAELEAIDPDVRKYGMHVAAHVEHEKRIGELETTLRCIRRARDELEDALFQARARIKEFETALESLRFGILHDEWCKTYLDGAPADQCDCFPGRVMRTVESVLASKVP